jgi:hypothetical protein
MEAANEAARRAVNGLFDAVKLDGSAVSCGRCTNLKLPASGGRTMLRDTRAGRRGIFHRAGSCPRLTRGASLLLEQARPARAGYRRSPMLYRRTLDPHSAAA